MKKNILFLLYFVLFVFVSQPQAITLDTSHYLSISGSNVSEGSIVSVTSEGYTLSTKEYDANVVGVVRHSNVVMFSGPSVEDKYPVVTIGEVPVRVSAKNGPIQKGDSITSSSTPGVGMKATKQDAIIGVALSSFTSKQTEDIGTISADLNIRTVPSEQSKGKAILDAPQITSAPTQENTSFLAIGLALILFILLSFLGGFIFRSWLGKKNEQIISPPGI